MILVQKPIIMHFVLQYDPSNKVSDLKFTEFKGWLSIKKDIYYSLESGWYHLIRQLTLKILIVFWDNHIS